MLEDFKNSIAAQLSEFSGVNKDVIVASIDIPKTTANGDLAIAVPRLRVPGNPIQMTKDWAERFTPDQLITNANAAGPYINFRINRQALAKKVLTTVHSKQEKYGFTDEGEGKRIIVEFSSPNIAKPFHAGHLRSTIIGNFIANLYRGFGWDAVTMNYLGDWGKQYGLLAIGFSRFGSEEKLVNDPIGHLFEVYVAVSAAAKEDLSIDEEAREYFKRMEDGDEDALAQWMRFRELSIGKYRETYGRLNVHFDVYSGESQVTEGMERALKMLQDAGLLVDDDGAQLIDLTKYKLGKAVIRKRNGTTLYLTRDIGAAIERYEQYMFDKIIYVVASQQDLHLKQLFKTINLLELPFADRFQHINFGMVKGMSTRRGNVVFLDDMLRESQENMHSVMRENEAKYAQVPDPEHVSDVLGMSAMIVQDMMAKRIKDYEFNWKRILSFQGATGPYLQFTHARLCSIERKAADVGVLVNPEADVTLLTEDQAHEVISFVSRYPDILASTMASLEPCTVVQYLFELTHAVSAALEPIWVHNQPREIAEARLLMYWSARVVLGNALRLIGLEPVERM